MEKNDGRGYGRKELSLNQKNKGAAIEKPLFVVQGCLEMTKVKHDRGVWRKMEIWKAKIFHSTPPLRN